MNYLLTLWWMKLYIIITWNNSKRPNRVQRAYIFFDLVQPCSPLYTYKCRRVPPRLTGSVGHAPPALVGYLGYDSAAAGVPHPWATWRWAPEVHVKDDIPSGRAVPRSPITPCLCDFQATSAVLFGNTLMSSEVVQFQISSIRSIIQPMC